MTKAIRQPPSPLPPVPFDIPQAYQTTLDNGLRVVMFEDSRLPLVSYRLAFFSGDANDPEDSPGLTSAIASMLTEGTAQYASKDLAEKIERLGASVSANSSDDFTVVSGSALSMYRSDVLQLIEEIVLRPTFPEAELDLYRRNAIENLRFQRSQPNFLANEQVARLLYGEHPYSRIAPAPADVERLTRERLESFHRSIMIPDNAVMILVGDLDRDETLAELNDRFGGWQASEPLPTPVSPLAAHGAATLTIVDRPDSAQANIVIAGHLFERSHPDYFPMLVMNQVLGAGASSRVFMNLREEKGYTYGAYTRVNLKRLAGDFEATAEVRTAVTGDSLKEFYYELNRIRDEAVSDEELADAKNFLTGVFPLRAETQEGLTNLIVNQQLYGLPDDYLQSYRENVEVVTIDDVKRVAEKYIQPDRMAIVIVGDGSDILPQAKEFAAQIEAFDTNGNVLDVASFVAAANELAADVAGEWEISLDFQGQKVPVTLVLTQKDNKLSGSLDTMLGSGRIAEGKVAGNRVSALASMEVQGQSVEFMLNATADGDELSGTISAAIIPEAMAFTGTRK